VIMEVSTVYPLVERNRNTFCTPLGSAPLGHVAGTNMPISMRIQLLRDPSASLSRMVDPDVNW
jgi:hypothetical protein